MAKRLMRFISDTVPAHPAPQPARIEALTGAWNFNTAYFAGNQLPGNGLEVGPQGTTRRVVLMAGKPPGGVNGVPGLWARIQKTVKGGGDGGTSNNGLDSISFY
jgi:hypothetical protein